MGNRVVAPLYFPKGGARHDRRRAPKNCMGDDHASSEVGLEGNRKK